MGWLTGYAKRKRHTIHSDGGRLRRTAYGKIYYNSCEDKTDFSEYGTFTGADLAIFPVHKFGKNAVSQYHRGPEHGIWHLDYPDQASGPYYCSYHIMAFKTTETYNMAMTTSTRSAWFGGFKLQTDGKFGRLSGSSWGALTKSYVANTWYCLYMKRNLSTDKWDGWIDGTLEVNQADLQDGTHARQELHSDTAATTGRFIIDEFAMFTGDTIQVTGLTDNWYFKVYKNGTVYQGSAASGGTSSLTLSTSGVGPPFDKIEIYNSSNEKVHEDSNYVNDIWGGCIFNYENLANYPIRIKVHKKGVLEHVDYIGGYAKTDLPIIPQGYFAGEEVAKDDFNDNSFDTSFWDDGSYGDITATREEILKALKITIKKNSGTYADKYVVTDNSYNFSKGLSFQVSIHLEPESFRDAGIFLCPNKNLSAHLYSDESNWLRFIVESDGNWYLQKKVTGSPTTIWSDTTKSYDDSGVKVELRIEGTNLRLVVDGVSRWYGAHGLTFTTAYVYLNHYAPTSANQLAAWFDDFYIYPSDYTHRELGNVLYEPEDEGKKYKHWYSAYLLHSNNIIGINYTYSNDGETWTKHSSNPVIYSGSKCEDPYVVKVGDTYYCFYEDNSNNISRRSSSDGASWGSAATALSKGPDDWDLNLVGSPALLATKRRLAQVRNGAKIITSTKKFGTGSITVSDGTDDLLASPNYQEWNNALSGTNFTVEMWIYADSIPSTSGGMCVFFDYYKDADNYIRLAYRRDPVNGRKWYLLFRKAGITEIAVMGAEWDIPLSTWVHIALVKEGTTWSIYAYGARRVTATESEAGFTGGEPIFGKDAATTMYSFDGKIDEIRASNIARYTGTSYSVPSSAFTVDSNTFFLCHCDGENNSEDIVAEGYNTIYLMFYEGIQQSDTTLAHSGVALSNSITGTFYKPRDSTDAYGYYNPLFSPRTGKWDAGQLAMDDIIKDGEKYYATYHNAGLTPTVGLGIAKSLGLTKWERQSGGQDGRAVFLEDLDYWGSVEDKVQSAMFFPTAAGEPSGKILYESDAIWSAGYGSYTKGKYLGYVDAKESLYVGDECEDDFDDIRFTKSDGTTELKCVKLEVENGSWAIYWVKIPENVNTDQTIYMYFGNAAAVDPSDPENVFPDFDDFNDGTLDTGKWTPTGTIEESGGAVHLNQNDQLKSKTNFGFGYSVMARAKANEQDISFVGIHYDSSNRLQVMNSDQVYPDDFDFVRLPYSSVGGVPVNNPKTTYLDFRNVFRKYEIARYDIKRVHASQDHTINKLLVQAQIITQDAAIQFEVWNSTQESTLDVDWALVRRATHPEIRHGEWSSEETKTFTIDALFKKANITKTVTLDTLLKKKAIQKAFTTNALFQKEFSKTFATDTLLFKTVLKTFVADALLKELDISKIYTVDALIKKKNLIASIAVDAFLQKTAQKGFAIDAILIHSYTKEFVIGALLKKLDLTKAYTINGLLKKLGATKTFSIDALIKKGNLTKPFVIDSLIKSLNEDKSFTINAFIKKLGLSKSFAINTILMKRYSKPFVINALLKSLSEEKTFTIDSLLKKLDLTKTFLIDALLMKTETKEFIIDTYFKKKGASKTFNIDAYLQKELSKNYTIDTLLKKLGIPKTFAIDALIKKLSVTKTFPIDTLLQKTVTKSFSVDTLIMEADISKTFAINVILHRISIEKTFTVDALIKKLGITIEFAVDVLLRKTESKTFNIDTLLLTTFMKTLSIDALLQKEVSKPLLLDALIKKFNVTKTFALDTLLKEENVEKTFLIDTLFSKEFSTAFTIDALIVVGGPFVIGKMLVEKRRMSILTEKRRMTVSPEKRRMKVEVDSTGS